MEKTKIIEEQIAKLLDLQTKVIENKDNLDLVTVVNMAEKINNSILFWTDRQGK